MSLGVRAAKVVERPETRLLLARPGGEPEAMVETPWRALAAAPTGADVSLPSVLSGIRVSPMAGKQDKALLAALVADEVDAIRQLSESTSELAPLATMLLGLRLANTDPVLAVGLIGSTLSDEKEPWDHKFARRYLPTLKICVQLAPGVPAVVAADQEGVTLLQAELLSTLGRHLDAVNLLTEHKLTPIIGLARAATNLVIGQNEAVVALTEGLENVDDITALCLIARGVALRSAGRTDEALSAFDSAIVAPKRHAGMVAAALGERASLLQAMGDELAAQADHERITALEGGAPPEALSPREVATAGPDVSLMDLSAPTDDAAMRSARSRVRRHISLGGAPGTFGGRHHRTYQPEVEAMLAAGQLDAAESLLLGLIDAVEDEAEADGVKLDATFYLTLADLFAHRGDRAEYLATMERFDAAGQRFGVMTDADDLAEVVQAMDHHEAPPAEPAVDETGTDLAAQNVG